MRVLTACEKARVLVECGELIRRGEGYYEDMGGHIIHESMASDYFADFWAHLSKEERREIRQDLKLDESVQISDTQQLLKDHGLGDL